MASLSVQPRRLIDRRCQSFHGAQQVPYPSGNYVCGVAPVLEGVTSPLRIAMGMTSATQAARRVINVHPSAPSPTNTAEQRNIDLRTQSQSASQDPRSETAVCRTPQI